MKSEKVWLNFHMNTNNPVISHLDYAENKDPDNGFYYSIQSVVEYERPAESFLAIKKLEKLQDRLDTMRKEHREKETFLEDEIENLKALPHIRDI